MKGPLAAVAAVAAAVIAAAVPTGRAAAYPGANCFHNCNAAYGMCEYRSHTPNAECRRRLSGCTKQCYKAYYRDWNRPAFRVFPPAPAFHGDPADTQAIRWRSDAEQEDNALQPAGSPSG